MKDKLKSEAIAIRLISDKCKSDEDYLELYLAMRRLVSLVETIGKENFKNDYLHIYRSAESLIDEKPDDTGSNSHFDLLKREMNYLSSQLPYLIDDL